MHQEGDVPMQKGRPVAASRMWISKSTQVDSQLSRCPIPSEIAEVGVLLGDQAIEERGGQPVLEWRRDGSKNARCPVSPVDQGRHPPR